MITFLSVEIVVEMQAKPTFPRTIFLSRHNANRANFTMFVNIGPMISIKFCSIFATKMIKQSIISFYVVCASISSSFKRGNAMNNITWCFDKSFRCISIHFCFEVYWLIRPLRKVRVSSSLVSDYFIDSWMSQ